MRETENYLKLLSEGPIPDFHLERCKFRSSRITNKAVAREEDEREVLKMTPALFFGLCITHQESAETRADSGGEEGIVSLSR